MTAPSLQNHHLAIIKSSTHHIEFNYSKSKHIPVGQCISSPPFSIGGYDWSLDFYPHGSDSGEQNKETHVSLYLRLLSETKEVDAEFSFKVLDKMGNYLPLHEPLLHNFSSHLDDCSNWFYPKFMSTDKLEAHFCKDGMLVISVDIRVLSAPSGICDCYGGLCDDIKKLWRRGEKFDVTFEVEGERISAHKFMLAARSPVFEAEFYGPMAKAKLSYIKINNMKAKVFKALLCFVYTDNFEDRELKCRLSVEIVQDLFIAADRYALEKLKLQCQQRLWVALSVDTVWTTLSFAEQHSAPWLKEKCLELASNSENFRKLALTREYAQILLSFPSLLVELRQKFKDLEDR